MKELKKKFQVRFTFTCNLDSLTDYGDIIRVRLRTTASVVTWSGFLATDPEVRVRFSALPKFLSSCGSGTGSTQLVSTIEELLGRKSSCSGLGNRDYGRRNLPRSPRDTPLSTKVGTNFADKRRWLGRFSSLADSGHGV
jgi:hypothetical protein